MQTAFTDAIRAAQDELGIEIASSPEQLREAQQLRFRVYCQERGFEPGKGGLEHDRFDPASRHVLVRNRATGVVLGTVRVVLSKSAAGLNGFPMRQVCEPWVLSPLPIAGTGEISLNLNTAKSQVADMNEEFRKFRCAWHYAAACRGGV